MSDTGKKDVLSFHPFFCDERKRREDVGWSVKGESNANGRRGFEEKRD